jgi:methylated-DNA-[protein]-cysteine S-methyltransferase
MIYTCTFITPLGEMAAAAEEKALTGLWFAGQRYFPADYGAWMRKSDYPVFCALGTWLAAYFRGENPGAGELPLAPQGSPFRQSVWTLLREIPYGQTMRYGQIAARLSVTGENSACSRAVGGAVGHNPISLLIPCHRVIGANGSLTGYAGGLERKKALLDIENGPRY